MPLVWLQKCVLVSLWIGLFLTKCWQYMSCILCTSFALYVSFFFLACFTQRICKTCEEYHTHVYPTRFQVYMFSTEILKILIEILFLISDCHCSFVRHSGVNMYIWCNVNIGICCAHRFSSVQQKQSTENLTNVANITDLTCVTTT